MKDNIPAEEKLLRLIKGGKKTAPVSRPTQDTPIDKGIGSPVSNDKSAIRPLTNSLRSAANSYFTYPYFQKLLIVFMGLSFIYLAASLVYPWLGLENIRLPEVPVENLTAKEGVTLEPAKPYEFYLQALQKRQIFSVSSLASQASSVLSPTEDSDLIKNIDLIGVISGDNPQAVIEDKKAKKVYYLNRGQSIGELQIEDIQSGKIILNYKGQKYELYL
jgi:hypothetical protein